MTLKSNSRAATLWKYLKAQLLTFSHRMQLGLRCQEHFHSTSNQNNWNFNLFLL